MDEDALFTLAIESGAEDVASESDSFQIYTRAEDLEKVRKAVEQGGVKVKSALLTMQPKTTVRVEGKDAEQLLRLLDALEDHEDVQTVYSNFEISDELLEKLQAE